ncbi:MAG: flagellar hook-associated protein FlgK [Actinobacteria bacterium]|nr:flagellar hook-associated protein FlgK [Actinomycetota bacterium]
MSDASLYTALSGLETARAGLATTAQDISNVNTPGFQRETAAVSTVDNGGVLGIGGGSQVSSIVQASNAFLQAASLQADASVSNLTAGQQVLSSIQAAFPEPSQYGISEQLSTFWSAWDAVAQNPSSQAPRTALISDAQNIATSLNQASSQLDTLSSQTTTQLSATTGQVNQLLTQVANLNQQVVSVGGGSRANSLVDQRNQLVSQLAQDIGATVRTQPDGSATVSVGGVTLVQGNVADTVQIAVSTSGQFSLTSTMTGATLDVTNGAAAGLLASLNTYIPTYQAKIDGVASDLASTVNTQLASGYYYDSATSAWVSGSGAPMFLNSSTGTTSGVTAAGIEVNPAMVANPQDIAASSTNVTPDATNNGANAQAMAELFNATSGPDKAYRSLIEDIGSQVQGTTQQLQTQTSVQTAASQALQSATGVSTDAEMVKSVQYQQAYQAAAKVIAVTATAMQSLLAAV